MFSAREAVVGLVLGMLGNLLAIVLGSVVPLSHPVRDQVDNALLLLGLIGVLVTLLLPRSGMIEATRGPRRALAVYGGLSLVAVLLADFGRLRALGWAIKVVAVALSAFALAGLRRE